MKNLKNLLPLFALLLGFALVLTQSAFTPKLDDPNWAYDSVNEQFVDLTGKVMDNNDNPIPGTYSCLSTGTCSGRYDGPGEPSEIGDLQDVVQGTFHQN